MLVKQIIIGLVYSGLFYFFTHSWQQLLWFACGVLLGLGLMVLDQELLHQYYNEKEALNSEQRQLITRSVLFNLLFVPLSLFVVTSSGSAIGSGLVMGIWVVLLTEVFEYRRPISLFEHRFLAGTKIELDQRQVNQIVVISAAAFVLLNLLLIFN